MIAPVSYVTNMGLVINQHPQAMMNTQQIQVCTSNLNTNTARSKLNKKQKFTGANHRAGDWVCLVCNNHNYSFREVCNRCGVQTKKQNLIQSLALINDANGQVVLNPAHLQNIQSAQMMQGGMGNQYVVGMGMQEDSNQINQNQHNSGLKMGGNLQNTHNLSNLQKLQIAQSNCLMPVNVNSQNPNNVRAPPGLKNSFSYQKVKHCNKENHNPNVPKFDMTPLKKLKAPKDERRTKKKPNKKRSRLTTESKGYDLFQGNLSQDQESNLIKNNHLQKDEPTAKKYKFLRESEESTSGDSENDPQSLSNSREETNLKILSMFLQDEEDEYSQDDEMSQMSQEQELDY